MKPKVNNIVLSSGHCIHIVSFSINEMILCMVTNTSFFVPQIYWLTHIHIYLRHHNLGIIARLIQEHDSKQPKRRNILNQIIVLCLFIFIDVLAVDIYEAYCRYCVKLQQLYSICIVWYVIMWRLVYLMYSW